MQVTELNPPDSILIPLIRADYIPRPNKQNCLWVRRTPGFTKLFTHELAYLSNMYPCVIDVNGKVFTCVESAYQAHKHPERVDEFTPLTGIAAKRKAKAGTVAPEFFNNRVAIMRALLFIKFQQPELKELLKQTPDCVLVEINTWQDTFWGICQGMGENQLGQLLKEVKYTLCK